MTSINLIPYTSLKFKNFPLETIFKIEKKDFTSVQFQESKIVFTFTGCKFKKIIIENTEQISFKDISIQFVDCYVEDINVNNIETDNISLFFGNSIISGKIKSSKLTKVSLNNCIVHNGLFISNQNAVDISYTEGNIFPIKWRKLFKSLKINDLGAFLKTKQSYYIHDGKKVTFRTNESTNEKKGLIKNMLHREWVYKFTYLLSNIEKSYLDINISLSFSEELKNTEVIITNSLLNSLSIKGEQYGKLNIENSQINNWYLHDLSIKGEAVFYNIRPSSTLNLDSKIEIHQCNLDSFWFDNIRFNDYSTVSFYRTRFGKAKFSSCSFPLSYLSFEKFKTLKNVHYPDRMSDNYHKDQYEIFLQLKNALESNGNFYESQKLQAISNDALKKINDVRRWDKAILCINSWSNNHGLSIALPLCWFISLTIIFYTLYLLSLNRFFINHNDIDWTLIGYYFSFIDPTHRIDFLVDKTELNFRSLMIDFSNKIISSFLIYQFIAAFRKYGKK